MAAALEERCSREVLDCNDAIEALKVENERLEGDKDKVADALATLRLVIAKRDKEMAVVNNDLEKVRDSEAVAAEWARKAVEVSDGLRRELTAEKESAAALEQQLTVTTRLLDSVKDVLVATVERYQAVVAEFGGETSALPEEDSAFALASWLKRHLAKLPALIGGCTDCGALAGVSNYAKILARSSCTHTESISKETLPSREALGDTFAGLRRTLRNFIGYFWAPFGRGAAKKMAEDKRAEVSFCLYLFWSECAFQFFNFLGITTSCLIICFLC